MRDNVRKKTGQQTGPSISAGSERKRIHVASSEQMGLGLLGHNRDNCSARSCRQGTEGARRSVADEFAAREHDERVIM